MKNKRMNTWMNRWMIKTNERTNEKQMQNESANEWNSKWISGGKYMINKLCNIMNKGMWKIGIVKVVYRICRIKFKFRFLF